MSQRPFLSPSHAGIRGKSRDGEESFARRPKPPHLGQRDPQERPRVTSLGPRHRSCSREEGAGLGARLASQAEGPLFPPLRRRYHHPLVPLVLENTLTLIRWWPSPPAGGTVREGSHRGHFPRHERGRSVSLSMRGHHTGGQLLGWSQVIQGD